MTSARKLLTTTVLMLGCHIAAAQSDYIFRSFRIIDVKYNLNVKLAEAARDSMLTKAYTLANNNGDTLLLFQQIFYDVENGKIQRMYEQDVTSQRIYLLKDSCYDFYFNRDAKTYLNQEQHRQNINFVYKNKDATLLKSGFENGIIFYHAHTVNCRQSSCSTALRQPAKHITHNECKF